MPKDAVCVEGVKLEQELVRAGNAIYSISTEETDAARLAGRQAAKALEEHTFDSANGPLQLIGNRVSAGRECCPRHV